MVMMAGKLMNAVQYSGYGGGAQALKHVQVPIPEPKVDEVLIKVEAATLNPVDWKIQKGALRPFLPRNFPTIPGTDIAGEVVQVGSHVNKFKAGDKVVATVMVANSGALTEYAIAKVSLTAARPQEVSAPSGAGLFSSSLTAYQALTRSANIKLDKTGEKTINILVTAASGGVGHYVVQLAKLGNTHITATCGARNLDFVRSLGADEVLDYKTPEGAALRSPSGKKYDFVIHCTSGIKWEIFEPNLSETGKVIDLTPSLSGMLTFAINKLTFSKKQLVPMILNPNAEDLEYVLDLVKRGKVKTMIDSKYSLSKAEDAWDRIISGHATGKIIVVP